MLADFCRLYGIMNAASSKTIFFELKNQPLDDFLIQSGGVKISASELLYFAGMFGIIHTLLLNNQLIQLHVL